MTAGGYFILVKLLQCVSASSGSIQQPDRLLVTCFDLNLSAAHALAFQ